MSNQENFYTPKASKGMAIAAINTLATIAACDFDSFVEALKTVRDAGMDGDFFEQTASIIAIDILVGRGIKS